MDLARQVLDLARQVHAAGRTSCWSSPRGTRSPAEIPDDGRFIAKPYKAEELFMQLEDLMQTQQKHCYDGEVPLARKGDC